MILDRAELEALHRDLDPRVQVNVTSLAAAAERAFKEERFDEADEILNGALVANPTFAPTWLVCGAMLEAQGEVEDAERAYRTALELDADSKASLKLAELLFSLGNFDEAASLAEWIVREHAQPELRESAAYLQKAIHAREKRQP
jgi:tetratricopeptide (TPR) repeat protein